jgi:hypothetical protein
MKNRILRFLTPTAIAIVLRLGLEFVFGISLNGEGWSFIWGCIAALWIVATALIGIMIMFENTK